MPPPSPRVLVALIVIVLWGLMTHGTYAGTGDEPHYEMVAHSLAFDWDLDLTNNYTDVSNRAFAGGLDPGGHIRPGKDGRLRPVHDIGLPVLFAPYYALAYKLTGQVVRYVPDSWLRRAKLNFTVVLRHFLSFGMIGLTAWVGVVLFEIFADLSGNPKSAFAWAALLTLSPPLLAHGFLFFTEMLSAAIAVRVFLWLRTKSSHARGALIAGAATGYLLLVHARNVGLIGGVLILAVYRLGRSVDDRARLGWFLAGTAVLFAIRTAVTVHFWGTWLTTPHVRLDPSAPLIGESVTRVAGWLFDQEHGLLPYAPIYLLMPAGWLALWKRNRECCLEISVLIAAYIGVMTLPFFNAHGWRGGWSPAARFLVPVTPLLGILVFTAAAHARRYHPIVVGLIALQLCLDTIVWLRPKLLWNNGIGTSALLRALDGTGWLAAHWPSLLPPIGFGTIATIGAIVVGWLFITLALADRRPVDPQSATCRI